MRIGFGIRSKNRCYRKQANSRRKIVFLVPQLDSFENLEAKVREDDTFIFGFRFSCMLKV